jgi:hypothetical protein
MLSRLVQGYAEHIWGKVVGILTSHAYECLSTAKAVLWKNQNNAQSVRRRSLCVAITQKAQ